MLCEGCPGSLAGMPGTARALPTSAAARAPALHPPPGQLPGRWGGHRPAGGGRGEARAGAPAALEPRLHAYVGEMAQLCTTPVQQAVGKHRSPRYLGPIGATALKFKMPPRFASGALCCLSPGAVPPKPLCIENVAEGALQGTGA